MDPIAMISVVGISWLIAGILVGAALGLWFGPARARMKTQRAKVALADSQQRRALERLRENNIELTTQLEAAALRHSRAMEALKNAHASDIRGLEDELRMARDQLRRLIDANDESHVISGTSFASTQFSEPT